jgi:hypothetical protein
VQLLLLTRCACFVVPLSCCSWAVTPQVVLVLGILLCVGIVIWAKRALKKLQAQELEREASAAAADAAEQGTAEAGSSMHTGGASAAPPLAPLDVEGKLAAAGASGGSKGPTSVGGDLEVIVVDASAASPASLDADSNLSLSRSSFGGSLIPAGQLPPAAAADSDRQASLGGRLSSVSSLRGLLSGRFQRS